MVYQELGRKDKYFGPPTNATDEAWLELLPGSIVAGAQYLLSPFADIWPLFSWKGFPYI